MSHIGQALMAGNFILVVSCRNCDTCGMLMDMTTMPSGRIPVFTLGWRLRLALESADLSVQAMGETLGYSRSTISRWLNDQDQPRAAIMAQWSLITGVDRGWLETGEYSGPPTPPESKRDTSALDKLTQEKKGRSKRPRTTREYLVPAYASAA